LNDLKLFKW